MSCVAESVISCGYSPVFSRMQDNRVFGAQKRKVFIGEGFIQPCVLCRMRLVLGRRRVEFVRKGNVHGVQTHSRPGGKRKRKKKTSL